MLTYGNERTFSDVVFDRCIRKERGLWTYDDVDSEENPEFPLILLMFFNDKGWNEEI